MSAVRLRGKPPAFQAVSSFRQFPAMTRRPKALLFDLGNVCLQFDHGRMIRQVADLFSTTPDEISAIVFAGTTFSEIERGDISDEELRETLCRQFDREVTREELLVAAADIFTPDPAMEDLLLELSGTDLPLILVSNTNAFHAEFVQREMSVLDHFDTLVLSYQVRAAKPETAFYEAAFAAAGCAPEECFYTDDIQDYIEAARNLGVDSVQFQGHDALRQELELRGVV